MLCGCQHRFRPHRALNSLTIETFFRQVHVVIEAPRARLQVTPGLRLLLLLHLLLHLPPGHHPSSDGGFAVLASAQQGAVLAQVAVGEGQDVLVAGDGPLEDVL